MEPASVPAVALAGCGQGHVLSHPEAQMVGSDLCAVPRGRPAQAWGVSGWDPVWVRRCVCFTGGAGGPVIGLRTAALRSRRRAGPHADAHHVFVDVAVPSSRGFEPRPTRTPFCGVQCVLLKGVGVDYAKLQTPHGSHQRVKAVLGARVAQVQSAAARAGGEGRRAQTWPLES